MSATIHGAIQLSSEYGKIMRARKKSRRSTQIISKGRTGPDPVQGGINQTVVVSEPPQASRTQGYLAPPGDKLALVPKMGNIALIETDDFGQRAVKSTQLSSILDVECFDSLNGFPEHKDFVPFGVFANAQDLSNPNRDGAGAVQTAGTVTIINRSDETICPGQLVFVDIPDIVTPDGSNAQLPLVKELGAHPQKFCAATRPLHWNSERNVTKAIEIELEKLVESEMKDFSQPVPSNMINLIQDKLKGTLEIKEKTPMFNFGLIYACHLMLAKLNNFISGELTDDESMRTPKSTSYGVLLKQIALICIDHMNKLGELAEKHNGHTYDGVTGKFKRYPSHRILDFISPFSNLLLDANFENLLDDVSMIQKLSLVSVLQKKTMIMIIDCNSEIVNYFRSKVLGRALKYSTPGTQCTIQMGYYHS